MKEKTIWNYIDGISDEPTNKRWNNIDKNLETWDVSNLKILTLINNFVS